MGISNSSFNPAEPKSNSDEVALDSDGIVSKKFTQKSTDLKDDSNATAHVKQDNYLASEPESCRQNDEERIQMKNNERKIAALEDEVQQLKEGKNRFLNSAMNDPDKSAKRKKNYKRIIASLEAEVRQLREEKQNLFSSSEDHRFTENNSNIADLSDINRPVKLLDQFSEVYDNKWTYAFEYLTKDNDSLQEETVRRLLNILQDIYTICLEYTRKQADDLTEKILAYLGLCEEEKDQLVIKETEKRLREHRARNFDLSFDRVTKDIGDALLSETRLFADDSSLAFSSNDTYETEYVLNADLKTIDDRSRQWLVVFNPTKTEDVRRQLEVQPEASVHDPLENYIQKCSRICWLMCIKSPQMHLDFGATPAYEGKRDDVNDFRLFFNTTKFVSYTRAGMYVEYVVWPAVYLYKDGPLIKKGVAQGVNRKPEIKELTGNNNGDNSNFKSNVETNNQEHKLDNPDGNL